MSNYSTLVELLQYRTQHQSHQTAYTFLVDGETEEVNLTYQELDRQSRAIAATLQSLGVAGERALLLYPPGLEFITAFFGCLYAGVVAVPVYPLRRNQKLSRLQTIAIDAAASVALTTEAELVNIKNRLRDSSELGNLQWLATDNLDCNLALDWQQPNLSRDNLAFLQYTSGSTGKPKGVMVTHGNLLHNEQMIESAFGHTAETIVVGWLPLFHDMGLIGNVLQPLYLGRPCILMSPVDFLQKPLRWLKAISRYKATTSGGPNFAYDLACSKITPEQLASLDLSSWEVAFTGAEPVRAETLERFATTFAPCGFRPEAFYPCYGMAETTLIVSGGEKTQPPIVRWLDGATLEQNRVVESQQEKESSRAIVGCGKSGLDCKIVIANPESLTLCPDGEVGEIWVSGASVAQGYWNRPEKTEQTFKAYLADTKEGPFLRTGDLGFLQDGELFVTGRLKDLIIIRGRNHYPQDIELTVEQSHQALRAGGGAAFSVEVSGQERLVIAQEVERSYLRKLQSNEVIDAIRRAVAEQHDLQVYAVLLLKTTSLPKTSSGKVQRHACRAGFLAGDLNVIADWSVNPRHKTQFLHLETEVESLLEQLKKGKLLKASSNSDYDVAKAQRVTEGASKYKGFETCSRDSPEELVKNQKLSPNLTEIQTWLIAQISEHLEIVAEEIEIAQPLANYGMNSLSAARISGELQEWLKREVPPTVFYDYPTIESLARYLVEQSQPSSPDLSIAINESNPMTREPIAIVGIGCRFPSAKDPEAFWNLLQHGIDAITEVPTSRWNLEDFYNPNPATPGKMNSRWGGFLERVDEFDAAFFGISPREAESMDPQQRLLLEVSWEALENAGLAPKRLAGSQTGVFVGISNYDYSQLQLGQHHNLSAYSGTGNAFSIAANRLSYYLDLRGPSWAVDTACSSSLVAVHQACQSLRQGECQLALTGGVNLIISPQGTITFSQARMMAADGRCKTFSAEADGYVRGEGCGVVILKRLSDAVRDGDRIQGVIRGSAVNQDGRSNGLTAPNGPSQQAVIRQSLKNAGVTPAEISYVETHGTGTALGDPIEVNSLKEILMDERSLEQPVWIGSVKTNIGHLEAAAGISGLLKVVLSLQHEEIPPHLHLQELNPHIDLNHTAIAIPTQSQQWLRGKQPRLAGVSSFGFGGTNAHIILEEAPDSVNSYQKCDPALCGAVSFRTPKGARERALPEGLSVTCDEKTERPLHLLTLSAKTEPALIELVGNYQNHLETHPKLNLANICFTASTGRDHFDRRLAFVAESTPQLQQRLKDFLTEGQAAGCFSGKLERNRSPQLGFLFTGQGAQYVGMGRQLYQTQPTFRRALERCGEILQLYLDRPLLEIIYPELSTNNSADDLLDQTKYTQPALFAIEYALFELWKSWGVEPDVVMGHSVGEYVAATVAGVFSLEDGLKLVAERARLMQQLPQNGAMVAVFAQQSQVEAAIEPYGREIAIAAINGVKNIVISGNDEQIEKVIATLAAEEIETRRLKVSHAFHSPLIESMLDEFEQTASQIDFQAPRIPLVSNLTGQIMPSGYVPDASYWRKHAREAVNFLGGLNTLLAKGYDLFVEVGPKPVLSSLGKRHRQEIKTTWLPSLAAKKDDWQVLLASLSSLYVQGVEPNWLGFESDYSRSRLSLPTYPFQRQPYWFKATDFSMDTKKLATNNREPQPISQTTATHQPPYPSVPASPHQSYVANLNQNGMNNSSKNTVLTKLTDLVANLLHTSPSKVDVQAPFLEMGADSIVLIDAVRAIKDNYGIEIAIRQLFEELTTIEALASYISENSASELIESPSLALESTSELQLPQSTTTASLLTESIVNHNGNNGNGNGNAQVKVADSLLERVINQQIQLMSQQLEMMRSNGLSADSVLSSNNGHSPTVNALANAPAKLTATATTEGLVQQSAYSKSVEDQQSATSQVKQQPHQTVKSSSSSPLPPWKIAEIRARGLTPQQQKHLEALIAGYTQQTKTSKQLAQTYRPVLSDNRASAGFRFSTKEMLYPIVGKSSRGSRIWDVDNNEYLDLTMGFGVNLFGHNPDFIAEALEVQLKQGIQIGPQTQLAGEVAELICQLTGMERVTFCNSGTEAVMTALRIARTATGRNKIALFSGSYHGHFDGTLGMVSKGDRDSKTIPIAPGISPNMVEDVLVLDYDHPKSLEIIQAHASELAAVLVEPVQSRRPDLQPKAFLQRLRQLTKEKGIALIFDEMITGFRIHPGGAQAWFGIEADLATYGKIVGGGMPIGVVTGKTAYMNSIDGGMWNYGDASHPQADTTFFAGTFCKHPLTMAAAKAVLTQIKSEGTELQERLNQRTAWLANTLNAYFEAEQVPIKIVYFGSLFRFSFTGNMDLLFYHLLKKGVYIWEGRNCFLSAAHTDEDIDYLIKALQDSIEELREGDFLPKLSSNFLKKETQFEAISQESKNDNREQLSIEEPTSVPLTKAQKQLWILNQIEEEGSLAYNVSIALQLRGSLNLAAMAKTVQEIVNRHESLRTTIDSEGNFQQILPSLTIDLPVIDFSDCQKSDREVTDWFKQEAQTPFDLTQGSLFRASLLKLEEQSHLLVMTAHHLVIDGWSMGIILQELAALYSAECQNQPCQLDSPLQFKEYVHWQQQQSQTEAMAAHESYWLEKFAGSIPILDLPTSHPRPPIKTYRGSRERITLEKNLLREIKQLSRNKGCTLFMTLLSIYKVLLYRLTNQEELIVGIPVAGRSLNNSEGLVGYCTHLLPIRSNVEDNAIFSEYLTKIRGLLLDAYEHQDYPFASLLDRLELDRDPSRLPLITTSFNLEPPVTVPEMFALSTELFSQPVSFVDYDLNLNVTEVNESLIVDCDYNTDLFDRGFINQILRNFQTLLENIVRDSEQPLCQIPLLTAAEQHQLLVEWNNTQTEYPQDRCIHQLFERQVAKNPDAVAVVFEGEQLTYRELNNKANQLAHYLQKLGVKPDVLVGICIERSLEMVVGLFGILKAGGAYVPLDPKYPQERLTYMLEDSGVEVLLTQQSLLESLPLNQAQVVVLDRDRDIFSQETEVASVSNNVKPENLAYVIYTSGSTGTPKGAMVEHRGMLNHTYAKISTLTLGDMDRVAQTAPIGFDISLWQITSVLLVGGRVHIFDDRVAHNPAPLLEQVESQEISILEIVPSLLRMILLEIDSNLQDKPSLSKLRWLLLTGEALPPSLCNHWLAIYPEIPILNAYGPTECSDDVTHYPIYKLLATQ